MDNKKGGSRLSWEEIKKSPFNLARYLPAQWDAVAYRFWDGLTPKERELVHRNREIFDEMRTYLKLIEAGIACPQSTAQLTTAWPFRKPENKRTGLTVESLIATRNRMRRR